MPAYSPESADHVFAASTTVPRPPSMSGGESKENIPASTGGSERGVEGHGPWLAATGNVMVLRRVPPHVSSLATGGAGSLFWSFAYSTRYTGWSPMTSTTHGHHGIGVGKVDQFESVFRAAAKTRFEYSAVRVESVLVVSDRDERAASEFGDRVRSQFAVLERGENIRWRVVHGGEYDSVPALLDLVDAERPGLICTYRHLHSDSW